MILNFKFTLFVTNTVVISSKGDVIHRLYSKCENKKITTMAATSHQVRSVAQCLTKRSAIYS